MTPQNDETLVAYLHDVIEEFDCVSGTLHRAEGDELTLVAHEGIPESVLTGRKTQYQNIVFYDSPEQKEILQSVLETEGLDEATIETRIERLTRFYLAESYHQKYNLKAKQSLLDPFEEAGYDDEELRESPAAAKLNGYASGHDISEEHDLGAILKRSPSV